jgi:ATP-dependent Clp protease ATP-binding subunit ClpA
LDKGFSQEFGARNIKRTVNDEIKKELADIIISRNITKGTIIIDVKDNKLQFEHIIPKNAKKERKPMGV